MNVDKIFTAFENFLLFMFRLPSIVVLLVYSILAYITISLRFRGKAKSDALDNVHDSLDTVFMKFAFYTNVFSFLFWLILIKIL